MELNNLIAPIVRINIAGNTINPTRLPENCKWPNGIEITLKKSKNTKGIGRRNNQNWPKLPKIPSNGPIGK